MVRKRAAASTCVRCLSWGRRTTAGAGQGQRNGRYAVQQFVAYLVWRHFGNFVVAQGERRQGSLLLAHLLGNALRRSDPLGRRHCRNAGACPRQRRLRDALHMGQRPPRRCRRARLAHSVQRRVVHLGDSHPRGRVERGTSPLRRGSTTSAPKRTRSPVRGPSTQVRHASGWLTRRGVGVEHPAPFLVQLLVVKTRGCVCSAACVIHRRRIPW